MKPVLRKGYPHKWAALLLLLAVMISGLGAETGLALSGGGVKAMAHIGVLKAIDSLGIKIDHISGTSMGAVIGAMYCMGYSGSQIESIMLNADWDAVFDQREPRNSRHISAKRWAPMANVWFPIGEDWFPELPKGFVDGNRILLELLRMTWSQCSERSFSELGIPLTIVTTDIGTGNPVFLESGSLHEALRAAVSFPSLILPFELDGVYHVDGGIVMNMPAEILRQKGMDTVICSKTNTGLQDPSSLRDVIDVLNQSMNINITRQVERDLDACDILIDPALDDVGLLDFEKNKQAIDAGFRKAMAVLSDESTLERGNGRSFSAATLPDTVQIEEIQIVGRQTLSRFAIRQYIELETGESYTRDQIIDTFQNAYGTGLFYMIYPLFERTDSGWRMIVRVHERGRGRLGVNVRYNDTESLILGQTVLLNNLGIPNSQLMMNLDVGGRNEFLIDYTQSFSPGWNFYYRLFPYIGEDLRYFYDADHKRTKSARTLETGCTAGIGIMPYSWFVLESYLYYFYSDTYRDIALEDMQENTFQSAGVGVKLYRETLDQWFMPMMGHQIMMRLTGSREDLYSEKGYNRMNVRLRFLLPFAEDVSGFYRFEYGTFFKQASIDFDPFEIGGLDSFMGYREGEFSAPFYKIHTFGLRGRLFERFYIDMQINVAKYGNADYWDPDKRNHWGLGMTAGYQTPVGPVRAGVGLSEDHIPVWYLSFGYDLDPFFFSRR